MANINKQPNYSAGSITDLCDKLYDELLTSGSSLMRSDVTQFYLEETRRYVAWAGGLQIKANDDKADDLTDDLEWLSVDENTILTTDEWAIIDPVVRAHCDLLQAQRMEGAQQLGVAMSGLSTSEAKQMYREAIEQMEKKAFQCEPFSIMFEDEAQRPGIGAWYL